VGSHFDSMSLSQNVGCEHEVKRAVLRMISRDSLKNMYLGRIKANE
jgi:hypothetical protein